MTSWEKSSIWKKRLNGFCSYQYAAWMALFVPIQADLAMREVLNEQFSTIAEKRHDRQRINRSKTTALSE